MDTVTEEDMSNLRQLGVEFSKALTDAGFVGYEMEETEEELMKQLKGILDE